MKHFKLITVILVVIAYLLALGCLISCIVLFINGAKPGLYRITLPNLSKNSSTELQQTFDYGDGYLKSIVFIGDKTIAKLDETQNSIENDQVWTGVDGTLDLDYDLPTTSIIHCDNEISLTEALKRYSPKYVIITVGLENGVGYCNEETFKEYYGRLIDTVKESSPSTRIILQSIFPVSKKVSNSTPAISNDRIDKANVWISELAAEYSVKFLDTASALKNPSGSLKDEYDSGNGITLNKKGQAAVIEYIRTHGYK